jgi:hypothetical protein
MKPYRVEFIISECVSIVVLIDAVDACCAHMMALKRLIERYPRFTYEIDKAHSSGAMKVELQ